MEAALQQKQISEKEEYESEICNMVLAGVRQAKEGKVKDMDIVFDRLEKKYHNAKI